MPTPKKKTASDKPAAPKKPRAKKADAKPSPADAPEQAAAPSGPRGNFDLVVVESPAKAKTINKYLGPNFRVLASYGHVRDLDTKKKKGEEAAGPAKPMFENTSDAASEILRKMMERKKQQRS